jgi:hypothetical protein
MVAQPTVRCGEVGDPDYELGAGVVAIEDQRRIEMNSHAFCGRCLP